MKSAIFFVKQDPFITKASSCKKKHTTDSLCCDFLNRSIRLPQGEIVHFDQLLHGRSETIANQVSKLLSQLNEKNHSISWWSYIFTAKNSLSSPLFNDLIDIILVLETLHKYVQNSFSVYIVNSRHSHRMVILSFFETQPLQISRVLSYKLFYFFRKIYGLLRAILLIFKTVFYTKRIKPKFDQNKKKIGIFTYIDGSNRSQQDPFFGKLINHLKEIEKSVVEYIFYVYRPIRLRMPEISMEKNNFVLLFYFLNWKDFFLAIISVIKELFKIYKNQLVFVVDRNISLYPVIREYMIFELGRGYTDNLLIFRAARNMALSGTFKVIIYPFENKSLEKCLLLGLNSQLKTIGYQHSSITSRHFNFKLQGNEPLITPMPDKVITLGDITAHWLINVGNFPENKIQAGISLRHNLETRFEKRSFDTKNAKLLFAFSSSYSEISKTIEFLQPILVKHPDLICRFRNHIDFQFKQLDKSNLNWIERYVEKGPRNSLLEDLQWANVVVYVSSTVALEALSCGLPVLWLEIDLLNSDPLLIKDVPYRWKCHESNDFYNNLQQIANLSDFDRKNLQQQSSLYVNSYLKKGSFEDYKLFLN